MRIKVAGGAYQEDFTRFNAQRCVNWYPHYLAKVETPSQGKTMYLKPTPGLKPHITSVTGERVRAMLCHNDKFFFIVGITLYELTGDNVTTIGTMTNLSPDLGTRLYMAVNGNNQLGIFGGRNAYYYDYNTEGSETLAQITDTDFPGADSLDYMDGYGLVTWEGRVYFTELNDFTDWRGDNVYTPTYEADHVLRVLKLKGIIWNFGRTTLEPYYNDGSTPFVRTPQASVDVGLYAVHSPVKFENGIIFVGRSRRGSLGIYLLDTNHRATLISPGSIGKQINKDSQGLESAYAFAEDTKDGHLFYHLIIPDTGQTFTYDVITKEWHERTSRVPYDDGLGNPQYHHWRANTMALYRGKYLIGDYYSGTIFELDDDTLTEDSLIIKRERTLGTFTNEQEYLNVYSFALDCSVGETSPVNPEIMFSYSTDGGYTYRQERREALPEQGDYNRRLIFRKLGTGRYWATKFVLTDAVKLALFDAEVRGSTKARGR